MEVICDYCCKPAELVDSAEVYGGRKGFGPVWLCRPCWAWVGVHPNSPRHAPLGRLANAELRQWKIRAHAAFDPIWKTLVKSGLTKSRARLNAYKWLSEQMGIPLKGTHIGMFDVAQCMAVVEICNHATGRNAA